MSFIDDIINIFNNKKGKTSIQTKQLNKVYKDNNEPFQARLTDNNNNGLTDKVLRFVVNGVAYERNTDTNGIASLNMNLGVGNYSVDVFFDGDEAYQPSSARNTVIISPKLSATDLNMNYGDTAYFNVNCTDASNNPINGCGVDFTVNGVTYNRTSNEQGTASLKISLSTGDYKITCKSYNTSIENNIHVAEKPKQATRMEGTDINKTLSQSATYQCAVYSNNQRIAVPVDITVNGKTYTKTPDSEGLCKLNINLGVGDYTITSEFKGDADYTGSKVTNKIHVEKDPEPTKLYEYLTNTGCSGMGQCNGYYCACNSLQEAFYRLTGIHLAESTIASVAGTTSAGTGHQGINTAVAWFNKKYGKNVKIVWKNFSDLGSTDSERWTKLVQYTSNGAVFTHQLYRNQWGHYEVLKSVNKDNVTVLNSLGSKCNSPAYCGYIETRSKSTQLSYMKGISQPSIAYLYI